MTIQADLQTDNFLQPQGVVIQNSLQKEKVNCLSSLNDNPINSTQMFN